MPDYDKIAQDFTVIVLIAIQSTFTEVDQQSRAHVKELLKLALADITANTTIAKYCADMLLRDEAYFDETLRLGLEGLEELGLLNSLPGDIWQLTQAAIEDRELVKAHQPNFRLERALNIKKPSGVLVH